MHTYRVRDREKGKHSTGCANKQQVDTDVVPKQPFSEQTVLQRIRRAYSL